MDAIYNCSDLTIVAASGRHADTGLAGISVPRTKLCRSERIGSCRLAAMSPSFSELENCRALVWNTRGWTFQEKVFAKRLLFFTDYQVYFRCSESVWTEEVFMETEKLSKSIEVRPGRFRWAADREPFLPSRKLLLVRSLLPQFNVNDEWSYLGNFPDYAAAIEEYSQRGLTSRDDKLVAIQGILGSLKSDAGEFYCGLPEAYFLQSLLWRAEHGTRLERDCPNLPSWAWAGWHFETGVVFDVLDIRVIRMVLLLIRHAYDGTKRLAARVANLLDRPSSSGSHPSSQSSSSPSYDTDPGHTTSSSSTSGPPGLPVCPPMPPRPPRDWTTLSATGKAVENIAVCFGWPLLFRKHTVRDAYFYHQGKSRRIKCEDPLTITALTRDEHFKGTTKLQKRKRDVVKYHEEMAKQFARPALALRTVVVQFRVGKCLERPGPQEDHEIGCYDLLDLEDGLCIGEAWLTGRHAAKGRLKPLTFLTISWGLSLTKATVAGRYVPRWSRDAEILPRSKTKILMKCCSLFETVMRWTSMKHLSATYGRANGGRAQAGGGHQEENQTPSLMSFFDALLSARKGDPLPKFLWSTVNVLCVEHVRNEVSAADSELGTSDGVPVFERSGVGRVMFDPWFASSIPSSAKQVILE